MKSSVLVALAVSALTMTACTTSKAPSEGERVQRVQGGHHHGHHHEGHHQGMRGHHDHAPVTYQCEGDAQVVAKYQPNADKATIKVTVPSLSLNNQEIELKNAVSASGVRFVNDTNPASIYTWHIKGHDGVLSVNVNNKEYTYSCEVNHPRMPGNHPRMPHNQQQS